MPISIDTSVLLAIFKAEPDGPDWLELLIDIRKADQLTACDVVWAEVAPLFATAAMLQQRMQALGVVFDPVQPDTAFLAGSVFRSYREAGGPREHLIPDFLIGAHAQRQADGIAARDRGYLRAYFPNLKVFRPGSVRAFG